MVKIVIFGLFVKIDLTENVSSGKFFEFPHYGLEDFDAVWDQS